MPDRVWEVKPPSMPLSPGSLSPSLPSPPRTRDPRIRPYTLPAPNAADERGQPTAPGLLAWDGNTSEPIEFTHSFTHSLIHLPTH